MNLLLERYEYADVGTFGKLIFPDGSMLHTLEPPWLDNEPFVSCIPEGIYEMVPHFSEKYGDTWAMVGPTVSHFPSEKKRSTCVFHSGNHPTDTAGCVLVAEERDGFTVVNLSERRAGMKRMRALMEAFPASTLTIMNTSGADVGARAPVSNQELQASAPEKGAQKSLQRTVGGWLVGFIVTKMSDMGMSLNLSDDEIGAASVVIGSVILSPVLAWLGKRDRQGDAVTSFLGKFF